MKEQLFFIGVKGLIKNPDGQILLLLADITKHRKNVEPYWDIPGGRVERGSNFLETLAREIEEETGVTKFEKEPEHAATVLSNHQIPLDDVTSVGLTLVVYSVNIAPDTPIKISEEHVRYEWVDAAEAKQRLSNKYPKDFTDQL